MCVAFEISIFAIFLLKTPETNATLVPCTYFWGVAHCFCIRHSVLFAQFLALKLQTIYVIWILIIIVIVTAILRNAKFYLHSHFVFARYGHTATSNACLRTVSTVALVAVFIVVVAKGICVS